MTMQQVVLHYGIPLTTVRDLVFRGVLKRVVLPKCRRWWFDRHDLDELIEQGKRDSAAELSLEIDE
jgi:hypothetical protein